MDKRLTIQDVHENKKIREFGGYQSLFDFGKYIVSFVGGKQGLYGDFESTFEIAIIENRSGNFVTKLFCGGADIMSYRSSKEVEDILNIFTGVPTPKKQDGGVD